VQANSYLQHHPALPVQANSYRQHCPALPVQANSYCQHHPALLMLRMAHSHCQNRGALAQIFKQVDVAGAEKMGLLPTPLPANAGKSATK
jgi:hypothetical protein